MLVYVDGNLFNYACPPLAAPRHRVRVSRATRRPDSPGWGYTYLDTTQLSNGVHQLSVQVMDKKNV